MSSRSVVGVQEPRVDLTPAASRCDADDALFLASSYGLVADPWQALVLRGWLGLRADGRWAAPRCGLAVPRQNGKNAILEIRELFGLVALGERFLHTAHEVKTARKAFLRLAGFFENERQYPELAALVKDIRRTNGQEAIVLHNGGSVEFIARSKSSGRGFTVDTIVCDEAQELADETLGAIGPARSASPNPQLILTGTPPGATVNGEVFSRFRANGLEGKDRRLCWMEWSCVGAVDLDDHRVWAQANPGFGVRIDVEDIGDERADMDDETFARERLGMWEEASTERVIDAVTWASCAESSSSIVGELAFALDMNPERSATSVSVAGFRLDDRVHVETIENRSGSDWVVARLVELTERHKPRTIVVDEYSPAITLLDDMRAARLPVTVTRSKDMTTACGQFYDRAMTGQLRHIDQPILNSSLAVARKRAVGSGGGWAWNRRDGHADITPLVSATLAQWGLSATGVKRARKPSSGKVVVLS